jgi:hypothetical protein
MEKDALSEQVSILSKTVNALSKSSTITAAEAIENLDKPKYDLGNKLTFENQKLETELQIISEKLE